MYTALIHRIVILFGFLAALISVVWNMLKGRDLLYSGFVGLCVLFAVSTVLLIALKTIAQVLMKHLQEKKVEQMMRRREEMLAKKKLEEKSK